MVGGREGMGGVSVESEGFLYTALKERNIARADTNDDAQLAT